MKSVLEDIPGVGEARRKALMRHFKSINEMKAATIEQLSEIPEIPENIARGIYAFFHPEEENGGNFSC